MTKLCFRQFYITRKFENRGLFWIKNQDPTLFSSFENISLNFKNTSVLGLICVGSVSDSPFHHLQGFHRSNVDRDEKSIGKINSSPVEVWFRLNIWHFSDSGFIFSTLDTSVADPDPVRSSLFGWPGSGSGKIPDPDPLSTKRPHVIQIFSL